MTGASIHDHPGKIAVNVEELIRCVDRYSIAHKSRSPNLMQTQSLSSSRFTITKHHYVYVYVELAFRRYWFCAHAAAGLWA